MKRIKFYIFFAMLAVSAVSCKKDNFDGPNAELHGTFIDAVTKLPVPQDIANGTIIEMIEHYNGQTPTNVTQTLVVKNDGTYKNSQIFAGKYLIRVPTGNFPVSPAIKVDTFDIKQGSNELNFTVTPYIRVKDVQITKTGRVVTATFKVEQTTNQNISRIALFAHVHAAVGANQNSLLEPEVTINRMATANETFTISMNLDEKNRSSWNALRFGEQFYFRVGVLSSASGAKYNYAASAPVRLANN